MNNRDKIRMALPVLQAYVEGIAIEHWKDGKWVDAEEISPFEVISMVPRRYRIKPEGTYRAFKDADECWDEMLRHEPFGVIRGIDGNMHAFGELHADRIDFFDFVGEGFLYFFENAKFADGKPFGVPMIEDSEPLKLPL